ncbi:MAG: ABC transporter permease [Ignavibacteriae bacterium]|nr:ABC transporter permease [Ignavibacteriota bacterium]
MAKMRTLSIIKRELREKLLSKTFIFMTILLPVLMFGLLGFQALLINYQGENDVNLEVVSEIPDLNDDLKVEFDERSFVKDSVYSISYSYMSKTEFDEHVKNKNAQLISEEITGIVFIPKEALQNKKFEYYSKTPKNISLLRKVRPVINNTLVKTFFKGRDITDEELTFAGNSIEVTEFKISEGEEAEEEGVGNLILAYIFAFLLYISLLMMGSITMQSVIQEKSNRIVEVLLSSVSSRDLMAGKILGASITGLLQMAIWLLPVMLLISTSWFVLPAKFILDISMYHLLYLLINFFIGLVTFIGLFATVGSIFENAQEAQSGMWPIMILIIVPFFIALSMIQNPANQIAEIASMLPFASIIVMPVKMTLVDVHLWQFILSIVVNITTIVLLFPFAGKIYRIGILRTGKKPSWGEVVKWLRFKN